MHLRAWNLYRGESVAVCTIEKANVAINRLVQQSRLHKLCCVIIDVSQTCRASILKEDDSSIVHLCFPSEPSNRFLDKGYSWNTLAAKYYPQSFP